MKNNRLFALAVLVTLLVPGSVQTAWAEPHREESQIVKTGDEVRDENENDVAEEQPFDPGVSQVSKAGTNTSLDSSQTSDAQSVSEADTQLENEPVSVPVTGDIENEEQDFSASADVAGMKGDQEDLTAEVSTADIEAGEDNYKATADAAATADASGTVDVKNADHGNLTEQDLEFWFRGIDEKTYAEKLRLATTTTPTTGVGYCASWVSYVYQEAGLGFVGGNACDMWQFLCSSSDTDTIHEGMIIAVRFSSASALGMIYGHCGILLKNPNYKGEDHHGQIIELQKELDLLKDMINAANESGDHENQLDLLSKQKELKDKIRELESTDEDHYDTVKGRLIQSDPYGNEKWMVADSTTHVGTSPLSSWIRSFDYSDTAAWGWGHAFSGRVAVWEGDIPSTVPFVFHEENAANALYEHYGIDFDNMSDEDVFYAIWATCASAEGLPGAMLLAEGLYVDSTRFFELLGYMTPEQYARWEQILTWRLQMAEQRALEEEAARAAQEALAQEEAARAAQEALAQEEAARNAELAQQEAQTEPQTDQTPDVVDPASQEPQSQETTTPADNVSNETPEQPAQQNEAANPVEQSGQTPAQEPSQPSTEEQTSQPPAQDTPAATPEEQTPAVEEPSAEEPPAETPPAEVPAVEEPPAETPPAEVPAVEEPPAETPVVETPPAEEPVVEAPPAEEPVAEAPPVEEPPAEVPQVEVPPVETPVVEIPPVETPVVEIPPAETPVVEEIPADYNSSPEPPAE